MSSAKQYIDKAKTHITANRLNEAETELRQAIKLDNSQIQARVELANILVKANRLRECDEQLQAILQLSPDNPDALTLIGTIFNIQKRYLKAIKVLRNSLELEPKQPAAQLQLTKALRETGLLDESETILRKLMPTNPRNLEILFELSQTLALKQKDAEAMRLLMQAIKLQPNSSRGYMALADFYRKGERYDDAIKICQQCLSANTKAFDVAHLLVDIYWEKGDVSAAINTINNICNERGDAEDFLAFGHLAFAANELELAEKSFKWAGTMAPEMWQPHIGLAELYSSINQDAAATEEYKTAIKLNRISYEPHNSLAMFFVKQDQIDKAIKHLEHACKLTPDESIPHYNLGLLLAKTNKLPEAREAFCVALEFAPSGQLHSQIEYALNAVDKELGIN